MLSLPYGSTTVNTAHVNLEVVYQVWPFGLNRLCIFFEGKRISSETEGKSWKFSHFLLVQQGGQRQSSSGIRQRLRRGR